MAQTKETSIFRLQARNRILRDYLCRSSKAHEPLTYAAPQLYYCIHYISFNKSDQSKNEELRGCGMAAGQHGQDLQEILPGPDQGRRKIRAKREGFHIHKTSFYSADTICLKLLSTKRNNIYIFNKNGFVIQGGKRLLVNRMFKQCARNIGEFLKFYGFITLFLFIMV